MTKKLSVNFIHLVMFVRRGSEQLPGLQHHQAVVVVVVVEKELMLEGQLVLTAETSEDWPQCTELPLLLTPADQQLLLRC